MIISWKKKSVKAVINIFYHHLVTKIVHYVDIKITKTLVIVETKNLIGVRYAYYVLKKVILMVTGRAESTKIVKGTFLLNFQSILVLQKVDISLSTDL